MNPTWRQSSIGLKTVLVGLQSPHLQDQRIYHQLRHIVYVFLRKLEIHCQIGLGNSPILFR